MRMEEEGAVEWGMVDGRASSGMGPGKGTGR